MTEKRIPFVIKRERKNIISSGFSGNNNNDLLNQPTDIPTDARIYVNIKMVLHKFGCIDSEPLIFSIIISM